LPADTFARLREGALIAQVVTDSPAERAGIRKGDVVVKVDGMPVRNAAQFRNKVGLTALGTVIRLTLERGDGMHSVEVEIGPINAKSARE
jgi:serine protease Do